MDSPRLAACMCFTLVLRASNHICPQEYYTASDVSTYAIQFSSKMPIVFLCHLCAMLPNADNLLNNDAARAERKSA
ncbi:hypothetical protein DL96DRAFT_848573 [Flagelloscypha sp. PMI_526]|nr:hypothetical protein DL96DRAFT_848573 [Flagelloscypha sp. PMI_526]